MEETKEPSCIDLNDDVGWVVLGPTITAKLLGKEKRTWTKRLLRPASLTMPVKKVLSNSPEGRQILSKTISLPVAGGRADRHCGHYLLHPTDLASGQ